MFDKNEWRRTRRKDPAYKARENELQAIRRKNKGTSLEPPEKVRARVSAWKKANPGKVIANTTKRKQHIRIRTPKWLTAIDFERIQTEYQLAALLTKITGTKWEVDHNIPLLGKNVSGLHVPNNLQVVQKKDNLIKSNRFEVI
jgi:hypothetical protein